MTAYLGKGTLLQREDPNNPGTYESISQVQSIDGPSSSADQVDVTSHSSVGGYREYIPGLKDGGELTFNMLLDPADPGWDNVNDDFEAQLNRNWRLVLPNAIAQIDFAAAVTSRSISIPTDAAITAAVTLKVSGAIAIS